jgi:hypothetical protein
VKVVLHPQADAEFLLAQQRYTQDCNVVVRTLTIRARLVGRQLAGKFARRSSRPVRFAAIQCVS